VFIIRNKKKTSTGREPKRSIKDVHFLEETSGRTSPGIEKKRGGKPGWGERGVKGSIFKGGVQEKTSCVRPMSGSKRRLLCSLFASEEIKKTVSPS